MDEVKIDKPFLDWLISIRRYFHRNPELSFRETGSQRKIMEYLDKLGIDNRPIAGTGVIGTIAGAGKGKTVALRTDMDALKIDEVQTAANISYISENKGTMHACGHDGHMAMVLGAARLLQENKEKLNGYVRLIFQPAEEVPPGGAVKIIDDGGLDGVDAIIGIHLFTRYQTGEFILKEGAMMAGNCRYDLEITGRSGHHGNLDATIDPLLMASEFITSIRPALSETLPSKSQYVFGFGVVKGGEQFNQVPDNVRLSGSYRALDPEHLQQIGHIVRQVLDQLTMKYKKNQEDSLPTYKLAITQGYPVLVNDPVFTRGIARLLKTKFNAVVEDIEPVLASEDFARYLEKRPGTFLFLGAGNRGKGIVHENHSSRFDIDEDALVNGVRAFLVIVKDFLDFPDKYINNQ